MSGTRCTISILKKDKTIKTITSNYDGDILFAGKVLNNGYKDSDAVKNLINEGNISGLYSEENNSDRKSAQIFANKKEYLVRAKDFDFNYLYDEAASSWLFVKSEKLKDLTEVIDKAMKQAKPKKKM